MIIIGTLIIVTDRVAAAAGRRLRGRPAAACQVMMVMNMIIT